LPATAAAARERVVEAAGERTSTDDRELRGRGEGASDEGTEREDERRFGRERIGVRATFIEEQSRAKTAAANVLAQRGVRQWNACRLAARGIDSEIRAVIAEWSGFCPLPPASADRISRRSPSANGVRGITDELVAIEIGGNRVACVRSP
jgi:hypothetical protein